LDDEKCICVDFIFFDYQNAFDIIDHEKLLTELNEIGISGVFFDIIENNFIDCKQYVVFNDQDSDQYNVNSGVLHGGVYFPQAFNIFVRKMRNVFKICKLSICG